MPKYFLLLGVSCAAKEIPPKSSALTRPIAIDITLHVLLPTILLTVDIPVGEFDAGDVQCQSQVDHPIRVYLCMCLCTWSSYLVRVMVAVVSVLGVINAI